MIRDGIIQDRFLHLLGMKFRERHAIIEYLKYEGQITLILPCLRCGNKLEFTEDELYCPYLRICASCVKLRLYELESRFYRHIMLHRK